MKCTKLGFLVFQIDMLFLEDDVGQSSRTVASEINLLNRRIEEVNKDIVLVAHTRRIFMVVLNLCSLDLKREFVIHRFFLPSWRGNFFCAEVFDQS